MFPQYHEYRYELSNYMRHEQLPVGLQRQILEFYDIRHPKIYSRWTLVRSTVGEQVLPVVGVVVFMWSSSLRNPHSTFFYHPTKLALQSAANGTPESNAARCAPVRGATVRAADVCARAENEFSNFHEERHHYAL